MPHVEESDEQLIEKLQQGSEESFREIYERYKRKIYSFVYHFFGNAGLAEDCTQEVFIRLYQKSSQYRPTSKFSGWLYQMARNVALDALRKNRVRRTQSLDAPLEIGDGQMRTLIDLISDPAIGPEKIAEAEEISELLKQGIARLKASDREILLLCDMEGLPHEEAARILGYATQTLTVKLHRARHRLAQILKVDGLFQGDADDKS